MSEDKNAEFIKLIIKNLESNGFPAKRVSLPLEKLYEAADKKDLNLNDILQQMQQEDKIEHSKELDKIVFSATTAPSSTASPFAGIDPEALKNMDKPEMMQKMQEMMAQLTPEQMTEIQEAYSKMIPEEKEEVMKKGKDMGIVD